MANRERGYVLRPVTVWSSAENTGLICIIYERDRDINLQDREDVLASGALLSPVIYNVYDVARLNTPRKRSLRSEPRRRLHA